MSILIKFKDKIMCDSTRNNDEQLFSVSQTYSGALYLKKDATTTALYGDIYKITTLDEDVLSVSFSQNKNVIIIDNLEVIGKTSCEILKTHELVINGVKLPNQITINDITGDKDIIPHRKNDVWEGIDIDNELEKRIKSHFEENYKTIPTGAIHWCYMKLEDYINTDTTPDDSILKKDFLLCDGRRYLKSDYPKLAKVLENQKVTHHIKTTKFYYPDLRDSSDGDYFFVPDLRHMFISNTTDYSQIGRYLPDCKGDDETVDHKQHRHFIAYGSYDAKEFNQYHKDYPSVYPNTHLAKNEGNTTLYTDITSDNYKPTQPVIPVNVINNTTYTFNKDSEVGILPLYNNPRTAYKSGMIGFGEDNDNKKVNSVPVDIFFCRNNTPVLYKNFVGKSSCDINSFISTNTESKDYTIISKGHENYPDFYAMLPLIKI